MLLRRITQHLKDQNWFAVWLDLFIVVVGVFIGIQVSNWNDSQNDIKTGQDYISRIQENLLYTNKDLKTRIEYYNSIKRHALRSLDALNHPTEKLGSSFIIDTYQATYGFAIPIVREAYDELLSVGAINTIPDRRIRQKLAEYYRSIDVAEEISLLKITPYRDYIRSVIPYRTQMTIGSKCTPIMSDTSKGVTLISLPDSCSLELSNEQVSGVIARLNEADLQSNLTLHLADIEVKLFAYKRSLKRTQYLYNFLEEANK